MKIAGLIAAVLLASAALSEDAGITGQYMEDRTMRVYACPCEWSGDWANRGREAVLAWKVEAGEFGGVSLAGVTIVAVLLGRAALTDAATPRRSALYVDSAAPSVQREAAARWLRSEYGELLGRVVAVRSVPIRFGFDPDAMTLDVGSILNLRMRRARIEDDTQPWAQLVHDPFIDLTSSTLATSSHVKYTGTDLSIRWTRDETAITGYFGTFGK